MKGITSRIYFGGYTCYQDVNIREEIGGLQTIHALFNADPPKVNIFSPFLAINKFVNGGLQQQVHVEALRVWLVKSKAFSSSRQF